MRKPKIQLSFQWKIRIVFCLLSVGLTTLGVCYLYKTSYEMIFGLLQKNLRDVSSVGAMLFDHDSRNAIKCLKEIAFKEVEFDQKSIDALPVGGSIKSIPPGKVKIIHESNNFQTILHRLKMINYASYKEATPLLREYEGTNHKGFEKGMMGTYLMIGVDALPGNLGMYLVSTSPEATADGWPGVPVGTIFKSFVPFSQFEHNIYVHNELFTDEHYKSLSGSIPILDENNETIAILGVDYSVGPELNKLSELRWLCVTLILCGCVLSFLLSCLISKFFNTSLRILLDEIKTLKGIVPICSKCKKIRDDKGYWNHLELYIEKHSDASFSHGLCPQCSDELYGKESWYVEKKKQKKMRP